MDKRDESSGDAVLAALHTAVASRLAKAMDEKAADEMADAIVADISYQFGGQQVYFQLRSEYIARMVANQFTGHNVAELVARFRISRSTIYKIVQRERVAKQSAQCRLPGC